MKKRTHFGEAVSSTSALKSAVKACGSHFFDRNTMKFFNSRVEGSVIPSPSGRATYFVTSEQFVPSSGSAFPRKYTVKKFANCKIDTVGEFQQYGSKSEARAAARRLAAGGQLGRARRR